MSSWAYNIYFCLFVYSADFFFFFFSLKERTFLAWLRTSLTFASIGIAITQLFRLSSTARESNSSSSITTDASLLLSSSTYDIAKHGKGDPFYSTKRLHGIGKPLGATFIGVSILILLVGFHRYFEGQYWIIRGKFPASRGSVALMTFVTGALIITALVVVLTVPSSSNED